MGLATVFGIVKQSSGDIWVYSEEGVGTTFKIYLPQVTDASPGQLRQKIGAGLPAGNETILLAEDDAGVWELAQKVLQTQGYDVSRFLPNQGST